MKPLSTDQSAKFIELLNANMGILYKVVRTYCFDIEGQKDLIQEISLQAWRSFPRFDSKYKFSTWLYRVALNVAISTVRKEGKRKIISHPFQEEFMKFKIPNEDPLDEQVSQLYAVIGELKALDRALILLFLDQKSYAEISQIIGISESNVATRLSRLKKVIKEKLEKLKQL